MAHPPIILAGSSQRAFAKSQIDAAPAGYWVTIKEPTRTDAQNKKLWPMLKDVSNQVDWYGNKLKDYEWKDVLTASLKRQKVVPGIDGGFVSIGSKTSTMGMRMFSDLIELIYAFGAEHDVKWTEPMEKETT